LAGRVEVIMEKTYDCKVATSSTEERIDEMVKARQEKSQEIRKLQNEAREIEWQLMQTLVEEKMYFALNINWSRLNRKAR
jgi:prefoldin subunit 5